MESENFNKWSVNDLKNLLLQYNIEPANINGSGKNNNVIKADLVRTARKIKAYTNINDETKGINHNLPIDVINEILNVSDISTIINLCNTSNIYQNICNEQFWKKIAERELMPIKTTIKDWINEYLHHQYEVNILIQMLNDKMTIIINLPTPFLVFDEVNYLSFIGGTYETYLINNVIVNKEKLSQYLIKLLYQYPYVSPYSLYVPLRKKHMKEFIDRAISIKKTKSVPYKQAVKLWYKYYQ